MEYTDAEKTLIESTKWPESEEAATADAMILHGARLAAAWSADSRELMTKAYAFDKDAPERKPALRAYMDALVAMIAEAQVVDLLVQVQADDATAADVLARRLWDLTEDGGVLMELMWEYIDARGVDADAVFDLSEREAVTNHPNGSTK